MIAHAVLWPIGVTAGIGYVKQRRLPERAFKVIESHVAVTRSSPSPRKLTGGRGPRARGSDSPGKTSSRSHRDSQLDDLSGRDRPQRPSDEEIEVSGFPRKGNRRGHTSKISGAAPPCTTCGAPVEPNRPVCPRGHRQ